VTSANRSNQGLGYADVVVKLAKERRIDVAKGTANQRGFPEKIEKSSK
jgi:hypothetical protein